MCCEDYEHSEKISDLKSVFQGYEVERKKKAAEESFHFKRGHKEGESPVAHLGKKAVISSESED